MEKLYINRRLKVADKYLSETEVLERGQVFVVLAEPGGGKTELLAKLGELLQVQPVRASIFRHQTHHPCSTALIIDALDEAAKIDQSAIDHIVVRARDIATSTVIFASRSYEWDEARTRFVAECFRVDPVIVRIEHFRPDEQQKLFLNYLPDEDFAAFSAEVDRFQLSPLLGNPQFLQLFADAYIQSGRQFTSKAQIFRDAVERLAREMDAKASVKRPTTSKIVHAASEVMAKILLSGASGVSVSEPSANIDYPYSADLASDQIELVLLALDTKLFLPTQENNCHDPVHRIVAEYCAARYLVHRVSDTQNPVSLRRLMAVIAPNGAVRDELRGLLGWMASVGPELMQHAAIDLDPYTVLANGDPSQLSNASKRHLLRRLELVATKNPGFRRSDFWRRFSVGGFFTSDLTASVSDILRSAPEGSPLVDLILELLGNSGGPLALASDVRAIMLNHKADRHGRVWASKVLWKITATAEKQDFKDLIDESTSTSLLLAADLLTYAGVTAFSASEIDQLLLAFVNIQTPRRALRGDSYHRAWYQLKEVIGQLGPAELADHLDRFTNGLKCVCLKPSYECDCRGGVSKVAGLLVDRYFETADLPHDPDRVWQWLRSLRYENQGDSKKSAAICILASDGDLRHELHRRAFEGITVVEAAREVRYALFDSHKHSGLSFREGDDLRMTDFAFQTGNIALWTAFWCAQHRHNRSPATQSIRRQLRLHAASNPDFAKEWAKLERGYRAVRDNERRRWARRQRRRGRREEQQEATLRAELTANRVNIENGNDWVWLRRFVYLYLAEPERIAEFTDDISIAQNALRNCIPTIRNHIPTLSQLAHETLREVAYIAFVSCWIQFLDRRNLDHLDRDVLVAAKVESHNFASMPDEDYHAFEVELDRLLFNDPDKAEQFAREYIEPGLSRPRDRHTNVSWLSDQEFLSGLKSVLPLEWLQLYPAMPWYARVKLFNLAAVYGDREALRAIIEANVLALAVAPATESDEERDLRQADLRFWQIRKFFFEASDADGWEDIKYDRDVIFDIEDRVGPMGDRSEGWPSLSAAKIYKVLDAFIDVWPAVPLPSSYGTGSPPEERAYRLLSDIVWKIGNDFPERAIPVLDRLIEDPRFIKSNEALLTLREECAKKLALTNFSAPTPQQVASLLDSGGLASVEDLRAYLVEELGHLQKWLRSAETDPIVTYYGDGKHVDENTARNRVVDSLKNRATALNMPIVIEHHMAGSNRCDFTVSAMINGRRRLLVVEAKGQWHPELYNAAASQLNDRYAVHQDAENQGIYLVFWFGSDTKIADRVRHGVKNPDDLRQRLVDAMPTELRGLLDVVVLDLSRQS